MPQHVSIQGFQGSFHEVAARQYFGARPALLACATFGAVVAHVVNGTAGAGLMAMENSLAGSIISGKSKNAVRQFNLLNRPLA